jgi:predicted nucleotidyltransferase
MKLPQHVTELVESLLPGLEESLGEKLVGVYVRGSLAMGDFIPSTSDIDLLVVTEQPVTTLEFATLSALHGHITALPNPFANRLEIAYIDRAALRRFTPGLCHPTLGQGETLAWSEHRTHWIVERWGVREYGMALVGPDPKQLIEPVGMDEVRAAVRSRLHDWAEWAAQPDDPDWQGPRSHKAYVVETLCRALYTLDCGALCSKPHAVAWALATLAEPWRSTVERSQAWRTDRARDPTLIPEVMAFVRWVIVQSNANGGSG